MLPVAIANSSSTSLMRTLHGIRAAQLIFPTQRWTKQPSFDMLTQHRSDARQLIAEQRKQFTACDCIDKEHIVPNDHDLARVDRCAPVALLRGPTVVVGIYSRADGILGD